MSKRFVTNSLIDYFITLINNNIKATLALKVVQKGSMYFFPGVERVAPLIPGIWVQCTGIEIDWGANDNAGEIVYRIRLVYARQYNIGNQVVNTQNVNVNKILEMLIDNTHLAGWEWHSYVQSVLPVAVDYRPIEDAVLSAPARSKNLMATAIDINCVMYVNRQMGG